MSRASTTTSTSIKRGNELLLTSRLKGWNYTESRINLADADVIPANYLRMMTTALAYAPQVDSILLVGLGGGVLTSYVGRFLPDARIDSVEIDPASSTRRKPGSASGRPSGRASSRATAACSSTATASSTTWR